MEIYTKEYLDRDLIAFMSTVANYSIHYHNFFQDLYKTGLRFCELQDFSRWSIVNEKEIICDTAKDSLKRTFSRASFYTDFFERFISNDNIYLRINNSTASYFFYTFYPKKYCCIDNKRLTNHLYRHNFAKIVKTFNNDDEEVRIALGEKSIVNARSYINSVIKYQER